jgi:peptide/nickel transport system ATP-binding protein
MAELIRLESCGLIREGAQEPLFENLTITVDSGERYSITGPSGSGKTSLALVIAGLLQPTSGRLVRQHALKQRRAPLRMVFQDPFASMNPLWTVREWLTDNIFQSGRFERVPELCDLLGLSLKLLERYPLQLSGGECQRFNLVCALAGTPALLLLDEATSMVDQCTAKRMKAVIESQCRQSDMTIVSIEHRSDDGVQGGLSIQKSDNG